MTKLELVARALAACRTGKADDWAPFRADAFLVLAACAQENAPFPDPGVGFAISLPANDP